MGLKFGLRAVRSISFLSVALLAILAAGGCNVVRMARSIEQFTKQQTSTKVDESYAQSLTPIQAGPGLVVCEPVARNVSEDTATFGAGCARWVHLHASGHGELGQTPLWGVVADARQLLPRNDLRLTSSDATRFADLAGVTHLALGTISSGPNNSSTLSYQLYQAHPKLQAVGAPVAIKGTHEQIVNALPQLAHTLAQRLGVKSPRVPVPQVTAGELTLMGRAPWKAQGPVDPKIVAQLAALAKREPLAGVLFLRSGSSRKDEKQLTATISNLMTKAGGNTVVVADVARFFINEIPAYQKVIANNHARFPNNYLLATTDMKWQQKAGQWIPAQSAAEDAVRAAPQSARAWLDLSELLSDYAQSIRQGKYYATMNARERQAVSQIYPQRLSVAWHATQLAPQNSYAWSALARAATFEGRDSMADSALWKAHALDKSNNEVYSWGLQMYQPKWGGDKTKLLQIARLAVQYADPDDFPGRNLSDAIFHGGIEEYREELLTAAILRSPKNVVVNYEVGAIYHYNKASYRKAEKYYRIALAGDPKYPRALASLADLYFFVKHDTPTAGRLYRQAVALAPNDTALSDKLQRFSSNSVQPRPAP